jgi:hypothetical protein
MIDGMGRLKKKKKNKNKTSNKEKGPRKRQPWLRLEVAAILQKEATLSARLDEPLPQDAQRRNP